MATESSIGSILAIDCGTVITKAVLLDQVNGAYRFLARGEALTTTDPPWQDIAIGVQHAIEQIEDASGRTLLNEGKHLITPQQSSGAGVDALVATCSAARPIRVALAGLVPEMSLSSARRAIAGTYSIAEEITGPNPSHSVPDEQQIRRLLDQKPDAICIVGGTDGGATMPVLEQVQIVTLACSMIDPANRPRLIFAGNKALRKQVVDLVAGQAEVRSVDNVRPTLEVENLDGVRAELDALYREQLLANLPGIELLDRWSSLPVTPAADAFARLVQYLWHLDEAPRGALGIDLGAANTTVAAVFGGQLYTTIRGDLGCIHGGRRIVQQRGIEAITRWAPNALAPEQALGMLLNREIYPSSVAEDTEELALEQAAMREVIREALRLARPGWRPGYVQPYPHLHPLFDPILVSGSALGGAARPGQVALLILDAVEPIGVSTILLDKYGLAPSLGAVASLKPLATVETLDAGGIVNLATAIAPVGVGRKGEIALRVRVNYEGGGALDVEVPYGSLEVLPLQPEQEAVLELRPRSRFDVGLGGPGKGGKRRVRGGLVGLIIDARGRPLSLPANAEKRQAQMQRWLWDVGG